MDKNRKIRRIAKKVYRKLLGANHKIQSGNAITSVRVAVRDIIMAQHNCDDKYNYYDLCVLLEKENEVIADEILKKIRVHNTDSHLEDGSERHYIELDRNLSIINGTDLIARSYADGAEFISATIYDTEYDRSYGNIDWYWRKGFSKQECKWITEQTNSIFQDCMYSFYGILWPPIFSNSYDGEFTSDLVEYCKMHGYEICLGAEYNMTEDQFWGLFRAIYYTDSVSEENLEKKRNYILEAMKGHKEWKIRAFILKIDDPKMRIKRTHYMPQSEEITQMKKVLRERASRHIESYKYDVAFHITDDYYQSRFCELLFQTLAEGRDDTWDNICVGNYEKLSSDLESFIMARSGDKE